MPDTGLRDVVASPAVTERDVSGVAGPESDAVPLRRNRDFVILWLGDAVSAFGTSMSTLVIPLLGYAVTGSTTQAGLATTAVALGEVLVRLPAGALVDRASRRLVLLGTNMAGVLVYGSLAAATLTGALTLAHLVIAGFLSGAADAFARPATSAATRTIVARPQLAVAYTRLEARDRAARIIGPPLGGALYSLARGLPFLVDAISYAAATFAISRLRTPLPAPTRQDTEQRRTLRRDVVQGMRFVWDHHGVRAMMLWGGLINVAGLYVFVTITLRLVRIGTDPAVIGLVATASAVAGLLGAVAAPALVTRARTGIVTIVLTLVMALVVVPMAFTTSAVALGALLATSTFLVPANNAGISAYMVSMVPDQLQGRVNSAAGFIATGVTPLAPLLAGVLLTEIGGLSSTLIGAGLTLASLVPLVASAEIRKLGRPATWASREA